MQHDITKEWFEKRSALEGDLEIGAGRRRREFPPAYGNCRCACHRSDLMHATACCHPSDDDFMCMDADVRKFLGRETYEDIVNTTSAKFAHRIRDITKGTTMQNIHAFTAPGASYPEFISVNKTGENYSVSVRSPRKDDGSVGETATITLSGEQFRALSAAIREA